MSRIYDPSAGSGIHGVCYNCLNGGHDICEYKTCTCRKKKHKPWWWVKETGKDKICPHCKRKIT